MHPRGGWTPHSGAPGTLPGPQTDARLTYLASGGGGRLEDGPEDRWEDREPLRRRRRGLREARRRRSPGAAGGRAALSPRRTADPTSPWQPPGPGPAGSLNPRGTRVQDPAGPRGPRPSQQLGCAAETRTPTPPRATAIVDTRVSRVPCQRREDPESPKHTARSYWRAKHCFAFSHWTFQSPRSPSPPHLSSIKLCPRNRNSLKGEERAIQSGKLLSNWYPGLPLGLLQQVLSCQQRTTPLLLLLLLLCHHRQQQALILLHFWSPANQARHLPSQGLP